MVWGTDPKDKIRITRVGGLSPDNLLRVELHHGEEPVERLNVKVWQVIARHQPITHSNLLRQCHRFASAEQLDDILQALIKSLRVVKTEITPRRGTKPTRTYKILSSSDTIQENVSGKPDIRQEKLTDEEVADQKKCPLKKAGIWIYKGVAVIENHAGYMSVEEIDLHIREYVLSLNRHIKELKEKVDALEKVNELIGGRGKRQTIPKDVRMCIYETDRGRCVECGKDYDLEFDHIIPVPKGGSSSMNNVQLLCRECNQKKGSSIG